MSTARRQLGAAGEAAVADRYEAAGYRILDRNWRCGDGEIDLVVARDGTVVFCEVKTRSALGFGAPVDAVGPRKQHRLRRLAAAWISAQEGPVSRVRFDVASVLWPRGGEPVVEIIEAAF